MPSRLEGYAVAVTVLRQVATLAAMRLLLAGVVLVFALVLPSQAVAADRDCSDFSNQRDAQRYFKAKGGNDPDRLDADGDGKACDSLPCPCGGSGQPRPSPRPQPRPRPRDRAQTIKSRIIEVIDGDTVRVKPLEASRRSTYLVRLIGIDTPETRKPGVRVECGGKEATSSMFDLGFTAPVDRDGDGLLDRKGGQGRRVLLRTDPSQDLFDSFGRLLAYADVRGGPTLAGAQLKRGWAKVYVFRKPFRQLSQFRSIQRRAKSTRSGVWGGCGGDFHSEQ